jgi:hypothetical protein
MRRSFFLLLGLGFAVAAPLAPAQPDPSIFRPQNIPQQQTASEPGRALPPSKPIPRGFIFAGAVVVFLIAALLLFKAVGAWRSSNLFDRQYRFPHPAAIPARLGGARCGGQMATLNFGAPLPNESRRKDAQ